MHPEQMDEVSLRQVVSINYFNKGLLVPQLAIAVDKHLLIHRHLKFTLDLLLKLANISEALGHYLLHFLGFGRANIDFDLKLLSIHIRL